MSELRKMKVVNPKAKAPWQRMFPDPEVARIKSLTREQILAMGLTEIIDAAKVGNVHASNFLTALEERFAPEPV